MFYQINSENFPNKYHSDLAIFIEVYKSYPTMNQMNFKQNFLSYFELLTIINMFSYL